MTEEREREREREREERERPVEIREKEGLQGFLSPFRDFSAPDDKRAGQSCPSQGAKDQRVQLESYEKTVRSPCTFS
jgi:hypothetical protein